MRKSGVKVPYRPTLKENKKERERIKSASVASPDSGESERMD